MNPILLPMTLEQQVFDFYELEVFATEMYKQQKHRVPPSLLPIMEHFQRIEEAHIERFAHLYQKITGRPPRFRWLPTLAARVATALIAPFGWKAILRFECWVERHAVKDYTAAMNWVQHPEARKAIQDTLADEEVHTPYLEVLRRFREEEQHHIDEMTKRLQQKTLST